MTRGARHVRSVDDQQADDCGCRGGGCGRGGRRVLPAPHAPRRRRPAAAPPASAPAEPAIQHPVPPAGDAASRGPLPTLAESDPAIKDALGEVAGSGAVAQYLVPDGIIRRIVVTIDNLPRQKVAAEKRPTVPVPGIFQANGR